MLHNIAVSIKSASMPNTIVSLLSMRTQAYNWQSIRNTCAFARLALWTTCTRNHSQCTHRNAQRKHAPTEPTQTPGPQSLAMSLPFASHTACALVLMAATAFVMMSAGIAMAVRRKRSWL